MALFVFLVEVFGISFSGAAKPFTQLDNGLAYLTG